MYDLSVVIPVYNVEKYVAQCLDSIVNQSIGIENIEVIIVNDATWKLWKNMLLNILLLK